MLPAVQAAMKIAPLRGQAFCPGAGAVRRRPDANQRFEVNNMLPGDTETKYFCVKAYHDADITLFFKADVTEQTKSLGDVLHIKVTHLDSGKVLFDAPFTEIDGQAVSELLKTNAQEETTAYYQIDVSLDTSVGNEYQAAKLLADFQWYVEDEGGLTPAAADWRHFQFCHVDHVGGLLPAIDPASAVWAAEKGGAAWIRQTRRQKN